MGSGVQSCASGSGGAACASGNGWKACADGSGSPGSPCTVLTFNYFYISKEPTGLYDSNGWLYLSSPEFTIVTLTATAGASLAGTMCDDGEIFIQAVSTGTVNVAYAMAVGLGAAGFGSPLTPSADPHSTISVYVNSTYMGVVAPGANLNVSVTAGDDIELWLNIVNYTTVGKSTRIMLGQDFNGLAECVLSGATSGFCSSSDWYCVPPYTPDPRPTLPSGLNSTYTLTLPFDIDGVFSSTQAGYGGASILNASVFGSPIIVTLTRTSPTSNLWAGTYGSGPTYFFGLSLSSAGNCWGWWVGNHSAVWYSTYYNHQRICGSMTGTGSPVGHYMNGPYNNGDIT